MQRLNAAMVDDQPSVVWECVVLAATADVSELRHEYDCGGPTRIDIWASFAHLDIRFVADICAVSDSEMETENPVDYFQWQVFDAARALGLSGAGIFVDVGKAEVAERTQRRRAALPKKKGEPPAFIRKHVRPFLESIRDDASTDRTWKHDDGDVRLTIRFVASEGVMSGGSAPTFAWPRTSKNNPLYRALDKKARQLRRSGYEGVKGIIACDAGCESLDSAEDDDWLVLEFDGPDPATAPYRVPDPESGAP